MGMGETDELRCRNLWLTRYFITMFEHQFIDESAYTAALRPTMASSLIAADP
jgi:hypothetical protein